MQSVSELWRLLEQWGQENAPEMVSNLNPPATEEEILAAEKAVAFEFPDYYKQSLAIHNGESGWVPRVFAEWGCHLSLERMVEEWTSRQQHASNEEFEGVEQELISDGIISVTGPVQVRHYLPAWIPIMESNGDIFWAMDFAPASGGDMGQIIEVDWECNSWKVIAKSFPDFLSDYVTGLLNGRFELHEGLPLMKLQ